MGLLYSKLKIFHYKEKIDSLHSSSPDILPPVHVRIKPTNICGHNCYYCAYKVDNLQLGQDMATRDSIPANKMMEIIDDLEELGVKAVTFSGGGDPFCYPHLLGAVKRLSESSIGFASLTNGSLLKGELAEVFANHATWLRISMDGWDDASYSEYRGVKDGEHTKILGNMRDFKKIGGSCYLGISIVVDEKNSDHIFDMVSLLKNVGVDSVKVSPCIISNDGTVNKDYHDRFFDRVQTQVTKASAKFADDNFEIFNAYHFEELKFIKNYSWCPYIQILPIIGADMNVYSCQDKAYNKECGLIGTIKGRSFKDFWSTEKNKFFTINPSRDCEHRCVAHEKNMLIHEYIETNITHMPFV